MLKLADFDVVAWRIPIVSTTSLTRKCRHPFLSRQGLPPRKRYEFINLSYDRPYYVSRYLRERGEAEGK